MEILKVMGLFAIVPATILVTVSYFVIFSLTKLEKGVLRIFGMVVAGLLWIAAFTVFSGGIYLSAQAPGTPCGQSFSGGCACQQCCAGCNCPCGYRSGSSKEPYHKMMMDPHHGMLIDPHHGMDSQPSGKMPCKTADPNK